EFIWCKAKEERKARVLEQAGYDMSLDSADWASIQYQNANNSVRVSDAFMESATKGEEFNLTARTDGTVLETKDARELLHQIAHAAWECADPGVQYDTTINSWHTLPNTSRINASNPCAAAITGLMTGRAYRKSAEIAARMGPFDGYQVNRAPMVGVIAKHRAAVGNIEHADSVPADLLGHCRKAWDDALDLGEIHGFR